jgi:hypothetical protein
MGVQSSSMRSFLLTSFVLAAAAGALAVTAGASTPSILNCGSLTEGPTALAPRSGGGAACLLHAYRQQCRPAVYKLSAFGIDTIARDDFRLVTSSGRCRVRVTTSFTVVPQKPHPQGSGECSTLATRGTDVVASGCVGTGLPSSFSLTGKR